MLETLLERIAVALESLADTKAKAFKAIVTGTVDRTGEAVDKANAAEKPVKARGRPAKITDKEKETATPGDADAPKEPAADFLDRETTPKPKEVKVEDLRAALRKYAMDVDPATGVPPGMDKAREILKKFGDGAVRLQEETKLGDVGKTGILDPKYYAAVIDAVKKAIAGQAAPPASEEF